MPRSPTRLREELDYRREARHVALYRHMLRDEPGVHVPEVVPSHSTDRLLTMTWLQGEPLLNWKSHSQEDKDRLAIHMFRAWYVPFYSYGVIHGDPHLGNYTVRPDGTVNLMDFGCVRIFPPRFVRGSIELYRALMTDDMARAVAAYEDWGFTGLTHEMIAVLNRWAAFLYGPLMDDRPRRLTEGMVEGHGREMAQNVFGELRRMGGVRPPREFVFMDRAAIGLGAVFIHLRASINWHRLFESLIEDFDLDALARRQQVALEAAGLVIDGGRAMTAAGLTTSLSGRGPKETMDRLVAAVTSRGMTVFARIDHAAAAAKVGMELRPTEVVLFGNPQAADAAHAGGADDGHRPAAQGAGLAGRGRQDVARLQRSEMARPAPRALVGTERSLDAMADALAAVAKEATEA